MTPMLLLISITKQHLYWTCDHSLVNKTVLTKTKTNVCILSFYDQEKLYPTQLLKIKTLKYSVSLNPPFGAEKPERRRSGVLLCLTVSVGDVYSHVSSLVCRDTEPWSTETKDGFSNTAERLDTQRQTGPEHWGEQRTKSNVWLHGWLHT